MPKRESRRTRWYPCSIAPVHKGYYCVKAQGMPGSNFRYWNGEKWCMDEFEFSSLFGFWNEVVRDYWQGLLEPVGGSLGV